jgi:hypothetical protein
LIVHLTKYDLYKISLAMKSPDKPDTGKQKEISDRKMYFQEALIHTR